MELHYGNTLWDKTLFQDPSVENLKLNKKAQILIVGAGMSGNLAAYILSKMNYKIIVIDKDQIGKGSSLANTGLLQYWSDIMLWELAEQIGEKDAGLFYEMCLKSMYDLTKINSKLGNETGYVVSNSIYYATDEGDVEKLEKEYEYLKKYNLPVEYISKGDLIKDYNINKPMALKTFQDASVNPYKFINSLATANKSRGVEYFEDTSIDLNSVKDNHLYTSDGYKIEFQNIIFATGYSHIYPVVEGKVEINRTYAIASKQVRQLPWKDEVMFWETKDPYLYFRKSIDNRIIIGGLDEEVDTVEKNKENLDKKSIELKDKFNELVEGINIEIEYQWNALFGTSKDNLPFLGVDPNINNRYYILGYEGNGTCYSLAGSRIIADLIQGKKNPYSHIVNLNRPIITIKAN